MTALMIMRLAVAGLLVGAAGLFVVATGLEDAEGSHDESAEAEGESEPEAEEGEGEPGEGEEETLFGLDVESPALVGLAVALSLLGAAVVAWRPTPATLATVAVFALAFAVLDVAEVFRQQSEEQTSILVLALVVGLAHLGAAGLAGWLSRSWPRRMSGTSA